MLVSDYPERLTGTVTYSSFVLLTLDIAASIRGVTDETAIREAEALPRAKCLAWIYQPVSKLGSRLPHFTFFLVGRGLPASPHSFAAVPIAPNTPHPETGRPAVQPSRPFPWPDCFIHTLDKRTLPISRLYEPSDSGIALDDTQRDSFLLAWYDDMDATADEQLAIAIAAGIAIPADAHNAGTGSPGTSTGYDSASGSEASSRGHTDDAPSDQSPASRQSSNCSTSSDRSSSVRGALAAHLAEQNPEPEVEDQEIVLHVQVSGILDPSLDFGTVDDFLAVRDRLAGIEEDRAERAATAQLSRAAAPKTAAWLQGISAVGELEHATTGDVLHHSTSQGEPSIPQPLSGDSSQEPVSVPQADGVHHSRTHSPSDASNKVSYGSDRSVHTPLSPSAPVASPTTDVPVCPSSPQQPVEALVSASSPKRAPSSSYNPEAAVNCGMREVIPRASLPPDQAKAAGEGSWTPWTLRFLLSLVVSRIRALIARCRAFF